MNPALVGTCFARRVKGSVFFCSKSRETEPKNGETEQNFPKTEKSSQNSKLRELWNLNFHPIFKKAVGAYHHPSEKWKLTYIEWFLHFLVVLFWPILVLFDISEQILKKIHKLSKIFEKLSKIFEKLSGIFKNWVWFSKNSKLRESPKRALVITAKKNHCMCAFYGFSHFQSFA